MATKNRKSGLGKGLESLFADNTRPEEPSSTMRLSEIEPNEDQPRKDFDEAALAELADSIRQHGVLQPLLVRPMPNGGYQLVAGERRWRAARMAGLIEVPVVIRELTDSQTMELALIENLQREDLNPIEEALGYRSLMEDFQMTQERVAATVGKSRPVAPGGCSTGTARGSLFRARPGASGAGGGRGGDLPAGKTDSQGFPHSPGCGKTYPEKEGARRRRSSLRAGSLL